MSRPELERLIEDVKADKGLQEKIKSIHPSNESIVEWANEHGYDISLDELDAYIREQKGELTDEELKKVVGGRGPSYDWTFTNQTGGSRTFTPYQLASIGHEMFIAHPTAEHVDQVWAADKERILDASQGSLIDAAQARDASVSDSGGQTDVTFKDGIHISHEVQYQNGQETGQTTGTLRDGVAFGHDYLVGPGGVHERDGTAIRFNSGAEYDNTPGWKAFYSPFDSEVETDGPGTLLYTAPNVDSTIHFTKTPASADVTVTTDKGSSDYQVTFPAAEQAWAAHPEVPAVWNEAGTDIVVQSNLGWVFEHSDESGPETTLTSASGTEYILPRVATTTDWTVTNSQGDYRTVTPGKIYHGEVNWLVAHPKIDHRQLPVAEAVLSNEAQIVSTREAIENAWGPDKQKAESDANSAKTIAIAHAQDPTVQHWEQVFAPEERDYGYDTAKGASIHWGQGDQWVAADLGPKGSEFEIDHEDADSPNNYDSPSGSPYWQISDFSKGFTVQLHYGGPHHSSDDVIIQTSKYSHPLVYNADNPEEPWSIQWNPYWESGASSGGFVEWGPGEITIQGSNTSVSLELKNGHVVEVEGEGISVDLGSGHDYQGDSKGTFSFKRVSDERVPTFLVTSPYGEQWTIEKGDIPITPQFIEQSSATTARQSTDIGSGISVGREWTAVDSSGQTVWEFNPSQASYDEAQWKDAHPQATRGIGTWTTDVQTYETAKQMWEGHEGDPQVLPEEKVSGSKGDVSYTFTPGSEGEGGYELVIEGPDTYFHTESYEYDGNPSRWVGWDSSENGQENYVDAVYTDGQLENLSVDGFSYVRQEGSNPGGIDGPKRIISFQQMYGNDNQPLYTQVWSPDGGGVTLTSETDILGPHGRSVYRQEEAGEDPVMTVNLRDGVQIAWQKSDESYYEDHNPIWQSNLNFFEVREGGQAVLWTPEQGFFNPDTGEHYTDPAATSPDNRPSYGTFLDGETYQYIGSDYTWEFQTPHATINLYDEWGWTGAGADEPFQTDAVTVDFNNGVVLYHDPHFTEVFNENQTTWNEAAPVTLWVGGKLDEVDGKTIRPVQVSLETPSGGTETIAPREWWLDGGEQAYNFQFTYEGPDGNAFTFDSRAEYYDDGWVEEGNPTFSLDGTQIVKGQDTTVIGPEGRISVEWGVPPQDLPDAYSSQPEGNSGFVVFGVQKDVQVVQTEQSGHRAWIINNGRVIDPYAYASQVQSGEVDPKAAVMTNMAVFSQLAVWSNEAEAVDTTTTVQVEVEVEVLLVAGACMVMT